jgi:hypothetical protein
MDPFVFTYNHPTRRDVESPILVLYIITYYILNRWNYYPRKLRQYGICMTRGLCMFVFLEFVGALHRGRSQI